MPFGLPSQSSLLRSCPMKPSATKSWSTEPTPKFFKFLVIRSEFLDQDSLLSLSETDALAAEMVRDIPRLLSVDPSPLLVARTGFSDQNAVPPERVWMMSALAVHYRLNFGLVVRCLGREYTGAHRDPNAVLRECGPHIDPCDMRQILCILREGCPSTLSCVLPDSKKMGAIRRGNPPSIAENMESVRDTLNKEEKHSHIACFLPWLGVVSPMANVSSQGMVIKPGHDPRLVWDGTTKREETDIVMNDYIPLDDESPITFGRTLGDFI